VGTIADQLRERRSGLIKQAQEIAQKGVVHNRDLSQNEQTEFDGLYAEAEQVGERIKAIEAGEARGHELETSFRQATGQYPFGGGGASGNPLMLSEQNLRALSEAIREGRPWSVQQDPPEARAMLQTTTLGSDGSWATSQLPGPVSLRAFAGIPTSPLTGVTAQMPSYTPPAGGAGVNESTQHGEFTGVTLASLTVSRYGRWTQVSAAASAFDDLVGINGAHAVGIARDLTLADWTAIDTSAGAAVGFVASALDLQIRQAVMKVSAATMGSPDQCVIVGSSTDLGLATGYAPTSGDDRGSVSLRVYGARVFPFEQATTGFVWIFNPLAYRAFQGGLGSARTVDPKDGSDTFGQWVHSTPVGVAIVGGAVKIDTTTP
jgi:hypothetical protein